MRGGPGAGRDALTGAPFWGEITATIDWCEQNYVFEYVAELCNTLTNASMALLALYGLYQMRQIPGGVEKRYLLSWLGVLLVALGSTAFHGTLRYDMQLLDELPMLYSAASVIYCLHEDEPKDKHKNWLPLLLTALCAGVTYVYLFLFKNPMLHEIVYGIMVVVLTSKCFLLARQHGDKDPIFLRMFFLSSGVFVVAWILWNIDNQFCTELRELRVQVGPLCAPLLELHGWWHLGTGYSSYILVLFSVIMRQRILGRDATFGFSFGGIIPYIVLDDSSTGSTSRKAY